MNALAPLIRHRGWVRALAVFQACIAAFLALTLVGLPLAAGLAWMARVLYQAARELDQAALGGPHTVAHLDAAMDRLAFQFVLQAWVALGMLALVGGLSWWMRGIHPATLGL